MTIKMIVDECDKYELPDITDTFSLNFSTVHLFIIIVNFAEPKDLTININIFQFDFVLFALNLF
jgi:hypothetical protein